MKKIYNNPAIMVVDIKAENILAGSNWGVKGEFGDGLTVGGRNGRGSYDDDDEEDEW